MLAAAYMVRDFLRGGNTDAQVDEETVGRLTGILVRGTVKATLAHFSAIVLTLTKAECVTAVILYSRSLLPAGICFLWRSISDLVQLGCLLGQVWAQVCATHVDHFGVYFRHHLWLVWQLCYGLLSKALRGDLQRNWRVRSLCPTIETAASQRV